MRDSIPAYTRLLTTSNHKTQTPQPAGWLQPYTQLLSRYRLLYVRQCSMVATTFQHRPCGYMGSRSSPRGSSPQSSSAPAALWPAPAPVGLPAFAAKWRSRFNTLPAGCWPCPGSEHAPCCCCWAPRPCCCCCCSALAAAAAASVACRAVQMDTCEWQACRYQRPTDIADDCDVIAKPQLCVGGHQQ